MAHPLWRITPKCSFLDTCPQVYFSIDIAAVPEVDSSRLRLRSDYDVHLRWYDPRLKFRDLRPQPEFNALGDSDRAHLWRPNIGVVNALGPRNDLGGDDALDGNNRRGEGLMRLVREAEKPLPDDYSLPREGEERLRRANELHCTALLISQPRYIPEKPTPSN